MVQLLLLATFALASTTALATSIYPDSCNPCHSLPGAAGEAMPSGHGDTLCRYANGARCTYNARRKLVIATSDACPAALHVCPKGSFADGQGLHPGASADSQVRMRRGAGAGPSLERRVVLMKEFD